MNTSQAAGLVARSLTKSFGSVLALAGIDLVIPQGQIVAIMGPSGSGKSTLLHCLSGILRPDSGGVFLDGKELSASSDRERSWLRRSTFGFVFQDGQLIEELPGRENVALPLMLSGMSRKEALAEADNTLSRLGVLDAAKRRPGSMSGGQAQRVSVARALVHKPSVVFADEPTGALDQATGHEVMQVLTASVARTGSTLVLVTHDLNVASWCDRLIEIRDGLVHADTVKGRR